MSSIYDWSLTAANNSSADSDINWAEGQAPSSVNNSARGMMMRGREFVTDIAGGLIAGGSANAITVTAESGFTALADGLVLAFKASANNTGATTLNVNAIGAKAIRKMNSTGDVALAANEIRDNGIYLVQYSEDANSAAGAWLLVNPTLSAAIYALSSLTTTDNTIPRFNGTGGALQTSGIVVDDSDNVSAIGTLRTTGAAAIGGATTSIGTNITTLAVHGGATDRSGGLDLQSSDGSMRGGIWGATTFRAGSISNHAFQLLTNNTVAAAIDTSQNMTVSGTVTATNSFIGAASVVVATTGAGSVVLRPNGNGSTTGQMVVASTGNVTINGTLTVTG